MQFEWKRLECFIPTPLKYVAKSPIENNSAFFSDKCFALIKQQAITSANTYQLYRDLHASPGLNESFGMKILGSNTNVFISIITNSDVHIFWYIFYIDDVVIQDRKYSRIFKSS